MSAKMLTPVSASAKTSKKSQSHTSKEVVIASRRSSDKPSPIDFDKFLPWLCLQFEILVEVIVIKVAIEKHMVRNKNSFSSRTRSPLQLFTSKEVNMSAKSIKAQKSKTTISDANMTEVQNKIVISAYYDSSGHLAEIAIKSPISISGKIIKSINICLPFHPALFKMTIKCGLTSKVLHEIAKMLPYSNITDICLDGCYIPEGNYFVLLDYFSNLKVLSLKRCKINDIVCKEIAKRIDIGETGSTLSVLDLGSNQINDIGVWYIADVLRRNRSLIHLNLSSNRITDSGLMYITNHLKEFQMNSEEIIGRKKRRFEFFEKTDLRLEKSGDAVDQGTQVHFRAKGRHHDVKHQSKTTKKKKQSTSEMTSVTAVAAAKEKFVDVFDDNSIVIRDGNMYCIGNLALCSLNLAYNELDYISVKRFLDVLNYQSTMKVKLEPHRSGLLRLVLDGNIIPRACEEYLEIQTLLNTAISTRVHSQHSQRHLGSRSASVAK